MKTSVGALLILTHSRPELLSDLMNSIDKLHKLDKVFVIVVRQLGNEKVKEVITLHQSKISTLVEIRGEAPSIPENISRNRIAGLSVAFESYGVDWVIAVEDDVILAPDTILFSQEIYQRFSRNINFRGINLGSKLEKSFLGQNSYCKTRFGIFGQGAVITSRSWKKLNRWAIIDTARLWHWDVAMQNYMKTGFTIAPNNSRYLDRGWSGTHSSTFEQDPYFKQISASFVGLKDLSIDKYEERNLGYWWRPDLRPYRSLENIFYWMLFLIFHPKLIRIYRSIKNLAAKVTKKLQT